MILRGRRILLATVAIGLAGSAFGEQALAVELPPPPALEPAPSLVPTVDAVEVPVLPPPVSVERTVPDVAEAATAAPLPSVDPASTVSALAEPAAGKETVESGAAVRRAKPPARRDPRPARAARETAARGDANRTVSPSTSAAERTEIASLLPREAGAATSWPPQPAPSGAAGATLLQAASGGGPGLLSAAALSTPFGVPPDAGAQLIPVSTLVRQTLVTSRLERPG